MNYECLLHVLESFQINLNFQTCRMPSYANWKFHSINYEFIVQLEWIRWWGRSFCFHHILRLRENNASFCTLDLECLDSFTHWTYGSRMWKKLKFHDDFHIFSAYSFTFSSSFIKFIEFFAIFILYYIFLLINSILII